MPENKTGVGFADLRNHLLGVIHQKFVVGTEEVTEFYSQPQTY